VIRCGGCGRTDHAHLHLLAAPKTTNEPIGCLLAKQIVERTTLSMREVPPPPGPPFERHTGRMPYLYLWSGRMDTALIFMQTSSESSIPSQLIRRLLAAEISGTPESDRFRWDWRDYVIIHQPQGEKLISETLSRWTDSIE
jgi:hypothetical protein